MRKVGLALAALIIILVWGSVWARTRERPPEAPAPPPDLRRWELLGCYALEPEDADDAEGLEEGERRIASSLPAHLMLFPDSLDEWGRANETYRAVPLGDDPDRGYRWFTRADTLWVVWSEPGRRGGLALRGTPWELLGRARVASRGDSADVTARVEAWRVNCATRLRESPRPVRR